LKRRSEIRLVHSDIGVKAWLERLPTVEAARPVRCPGCGAPGAPSGGRLILHGHGLRDRILLGPKSATEVPTRRYHCMRCDAVVVVCPAELRRRHRYGAVVIAAALARWALGRVPAHRVREELGAFTVVGDEACRDWASLRRWARAGPTLWPRARPTRDGSPLSLGADLVHRLASLAPISTGVVSIDALTGALVA
jgi:ferredoxin